MSLPRVGIGSSMPVRAGSKLGPYEFLSPLGAGGMGEVWRARDTRLGRDVALKILPEALASDPGKARRFDKEARAASALNHPNIVTVYEVGSADAISYIAMELVEGKTLRETIFAGPLALKTVLNVACQIASGLARAHGAGIVHRDLKPENVMISRDGLAKVLDFGLAKRMPFEGDAGSIESTQTQEGAVVGTVGYMSPEQAAGKPLDYRSDQFSFGSILYEMAAGKRAFQSKSAVETLAAIINQEPAAIETINPRVPAPLRWIVARCLAKEPAARYASTEDLAQELRVARDRLTEAPEGFADGSPTPSPRRLRLLALVAATAILAGLVGVFVAGRRAGSRPVPDFQRLTFGNGRVTAARFAPDGRTIVFAAAWDGKPTRLFSTRTDGRESKPLELPEGEVVSVSSLGEIAMLLHPVDPGGDFVEMGRLARVPLTGGAPRELSEELSGGADWSHDGKSLAIARSTQGKNRLEFPIGKVLYETDATIGFLRLSPDGDRIAFLTRQKDSTISVETVDLAGRHSVVSRGWKRGRGVAWSPDGKELWFGGNERGWRTPLYAATLDGTTRVLMRLPSHIWVQDIARDGRVLVSLVSSRSRMRGVFKSGPERDLSWHEGSFAKDITPDGATLLFEEAAEGEFRTIYVRPTDGSPAKIIGDGRSMAISPDGLWVVANTKGRGSPVVILPTGAGEPQAMDSEGHQFTEAAFSADGRRLLLTGDGGPVFAKDFPAGRLFPVAPKGTGCRRISPDGKEAACTGPKGEGVIYPVEGGPSRPIPGFQPEEELLGWSSDGRALYIGQFRNATMKILRLDLATGRREPWTEFTPEGLSTPGSSLYYFAMTPDGKSYAYSSLNVSSDLYLVTGLQ
jgi:eukaryotic-like serine/threonine-protein kinase